MALVCHCNVVRERTIVRAIRDGACTLDDVRSSCDAATRCGGCEPAIDDLIARHAGDVGRLAVRRATA
jgi:NAD(P)H-nitrite reductase large subunit